MSAGIKVLALFAGLFLLYGNCASEPAELRHNPFVRPPSVVTISDREPRRADDSTGAPVVLATLVTPRNKLANVDGKILRPGEDIYGYLLVQVFENRAVFERHGTRLTVYVKPQPEESDE